jgi:hypothetical protein
MKVINYLSLDIFQRLQRWRSAEDVNDSSISGSRPWRKAAEKVPPSTRPVISARHTKMVAQTPHDTPTATRQLRSLSPDYQRRGLRQADLPSRKPQTARLLLVRYPDFGTARDRWFRFDDRMRRFKAERDQASERAMSELGKQAQELKLGYE